MKFRNYLAQSQHARESVATFYETLREKVEAAGGSVTVVDDEVVVNLPKNSDVDLRTS